MSRPDRIAAVVVALLCAMPVASGAVSLTVGIAPDPSHALLASATTAPASFEDLGTMTEPDADGVAYWSLDAPAAILLGGSAVGRIDGWNASFKVDPFVTNDVNVTNTSEFTQVFIVSVLMPIPAFSYDEVVFSSVGITATDSDGDGQLLVDTVGASFYRGRVDAVTKLTLDPDAIPITTADCSPTPNSPGCTATDTDGVASLPVDPDVAHELQIILQFALSPGDTVGITSRFEIVSNAAATAPEPTTGLLVALGLALLARSRRRPR